MTVVLDASALLALLYREPGADAVADALNGASVCAVNWSEVLQKLVQRGTPSNRADALLFLGVDVAPFTRADAARAATMWAQVRTLGLSLADRACLALAGRLDVPVLTADRAWAAADVGVEVCLIR